MNFAEAYSIFECFYGQATVLPVWCPLTAYECGFNRRMRETASGRNRPSNAHSTSNFPPHESRSRLQTVATQLPGKPTRAGACDMSGFPPPARSGTTGRGVAHPTPSAGTTGWHSPRRSRSHWTARVPSASAGLRREPGRGPRRRCRAFPG